jgi:hypothetical protein
MPLFRELKEEDRTYDSTLSLQELKDIFWRIISSDPKQKVSLCIEKCYQKAQVLVRSWMSAPQDFFNPYPANVEYMVS